MSCAMRAPLLRSTPRPPKIQAAPQQAGVRKEGKLESNWNTTVSLLRINWYAYSLTVVPTCKGSKRGAIDWGSIRDPEIPEIKLRSGVRSQPGIPGIIINPPFRGSGPCCGAGPSFRTLHSIEKSIGWIRAALSDCTRAWRDSWARRDKLQGAAQAHHHCVWCKIWLLFR